MDFPIIVNFDDFINDHKMLLIPMYDTGEYRLLSQLFPGYFYPCGAKSNRLRGITDSQQRDPFA